VSDSDTFNDNRKKGQLSHSPLAIYSVHYNNRFFPNLIVSKSVDCKNQTLWEFVNSAVPLELSIATDINANTTF
jgi:hypothetical protein